MWCFAVCAIVDKDGDKKADQVLTIANGLNSPSGLAFRNGSLYVAEVSRVIRFDDIESKLESPPAPVVVNETLPTEAHHGWKYLGFGPDGLLYVPVGAPCNVCERPDDERFATMRVGARAPSQAVIPERLRRIEPLVAGHVEPTREVHLGVRPRNTRAYGFYQRLGFRMDHVRQDYFGYYREPHYENGIEIRDMLAEVEAEILQVRDVDAFREVAKRSAVLGFDGKWVLHPGQIDAANEIYSPSQEDYDHAELILDAYEHYTSEAGGKRGAVMLGDEMIDEASRKMATVVAAKGRAAGMRRGLSFVPDLRDGRGRAPHHQRAHPGRGGQRLKEPSDNLGRQHVLAVAERDPGVGECEAGITLGDELLARHPAHGLEHAIIEHVPRADLLRDHLDARELGLHGRSSCEEVIGMLLILPETASRRASFRRGTGRHIAYLYG